MKGSRVSGQGSQTRRRLPAVDDHLVAEGARAEILRGRLVVTPPAKEPHAHAHLTLAYVLGAHVAPGYLGAVDMLTRTGRDSDFAPDASVYPEARDPSTGGRRLEELAFEIASTQPLKVTTTKARELARRGVRRVFCILVRKRRVLEWSRATDTWSPLLDTSELGDSCFAHPLPVAALLDAAAADEAVVAALVARRHPVIVAIEDESRRAGTAAGRRDGLAEGRAAGHAEGRAEGRSEGQLDGLRSALLEILAARRLRVSSADRTRIAAETDARRIRRWIARAATARTAKATLAPKPPRRPTTRPRP